MEQEIIRTERLLLEPLSLTDWHFIKELVNTEGWIKFIGEKNVHSQEDAENYIRVILGNPAIQFWIIKREEEKLGIISFIRRDYLPAPDIGFAMLPSSEGKGYAYEAAMAVLNQVKQNYSTIYATTVPFNTRSVALIHKLGLRFEKEIIVEQEILALYSMNT